MKTKNRLMANTPFTKKNYKKTKMKTKNRLLASTQ